MRNIEEPVTRNEPGGIHKDDTVTTHPAFAQIGASRVQGSTALYDSDFNHNHYMTITIRRSELHRGLNYDRHHGREELISVALSESQWATFVSAPNQGFGVPCTLEHIGCERVPGLPRPQSRADQFGAEIRKDLEEAVRLADAALADLAATGLSKTKQEAVAASLRTLRMNLESNLPFVATQFDEHMEKTVEKAKQEVHGYITNAVQRAGLNTLASSRPFLNIETDKQEPEVGPSTAST